MPAAKMPRERKLPVQQLSILAVCRFAEPIAGTSLFPYLPEMVESFGIAKDEIGKWAGRCAAVFSLCQAAMGIPWAHFSDHYGRKPAILLGLCSTMITSLLWGFSTNLPTAIIARCLAGAGNGNVGIIRTTVAEMVPFKELQPRAFSLMPLVWNIGSIFGPTIGGALANPFNVGPREHFEHPTLLERFPYALPNIVAACFFVIGIAVGFLYLEETLDTLTSRRDYGLILGKKITQFVKNNVLLQHLRGPTNDKGEPDERSPLLKEGDDEEALLLGPKAPAPPSPSYAEVLNKQAVLNLIVYMLLALHNIGFDQLLPVFLHHPPLKTKNDGSAAEILTSNNPLKFAGGFGLNHFQIGLISTVYAICGMIVQFFIFPPVARSFGVLNCLKACAIAFPVSYFLTPFTALLPTTKSQVGSLFGVLFIKSWASIFAFPCSTILLTNSASNLRALATLNGFATSTSALGRAAGPYLGGAVFTIGVERGYVIAPWWFFGVVGILSALPIWLLVEGEGFGGDDDHVSDDEESEDEEFLRAEAIEGEADAAGRSGPILIPRHEQVEEEEEAHDALEPLTRTTTMSSALTLGSDEYSFPAASGQTSATDAGPSRPTRPSLSRRGSRRIQRRTSIPFGMGNQPISRRYSSNLGQSLGTAGGYGGQ